MTAGLVDEKRQAQGKKLPVDTKKRLTSAVKALFCGLALGITYYRTVHDVRQSLISAKAKGGKS